MCSIIDMFFVFSNIDKFMKEVRSMDDSKIIELLVNRDEQAIVERQYADFCVLKKKKAAGCLFAATGTAILFLK